MEIGIIQDNFDKHHYKELRDEKNVHNFFTKRLRKIKQLTHHNRKRIVVYDVYDDEYYWHEMDMCYRFFCRVKYKFKD